MSLREREVQRRRKQRDITPQDLAVDIVKDEPDANDATLAARWVRQVRDDSDLLEAALATAGHHAVVVARGQWERQQRRLGRAATAEVDQRAQLRTVRAAAEMRIKLFKLKAENGKEVGALTGKELEQLETANAGRANIYRLLRKRVTGGKTVRQAWDVDSFGAIAGKLGQLAMLNKLFD